MSNGRTPAQEAAVLRDAAAIVARWRPGLQGCPATLNETAAALERLERGSDRETGERAMTAPDEAARLRELEASSATPPWVTAKVPRPLTPEPDAASERSPQARVLDAAVKVARSAPAKRGQYVTGAKVYWPYIEELRAALDAMGIDWRLPR